MLDELPVARIQPHKQPVGRAQMALRALFQNDLPTLLVTGVRDFYNPPNTAPETVVMFIRMLGTQPARRMVETFSSGCMKIHSIFCTSQEH